MNNGNQYFNLTHDKVKHLLSLTEEMDKKKLFARAREVRDAYIGNKVYLRGLIELSNRCVKNCYYCGIRADNKNVVRYDIPDEEVLQAASFALKHQYGSIVIQSGERYNKAFTERITRLLKKIHAATQNQLHITLSCGEQSAETYREWFENGAQRYLLRMETSNEELYHKIHPHDPAHSYSNRLHSLEVLKSLGYQCGTGIMIGLPFQTKGDLVNDLLFFRSFGIHMVGMGPYIEHPDTPLIKYQDKMLPLQQRFELTLKMIATLRLMMPEINIASTTALQTIDPIGREKGIAAGANVIMPNITPVKYKENYDLYNGKPCLDEEPDECTSCIDARVKMAGGEVAYNEWGDSKFFKPKNLI
jgi:biotin synthase